jgi:hypothetical protein
VRVKRHYLVVGERWWDREVSMLTFLLENKSYFNLLWCNHSPTNKVREKKAKV